MYYLVPAFKANLTSEGKLATYTFMTLPPVNYTLINNVKSGDVVLGSKATLIRIRPVVFAWPLEYVTNNPDLTDNKMSTTITYQGYIVIMGVGYNITDLAANGKVIIGNITLPYSSVVPQKPGQVSILAYKVLGIYRSAIEQNATAGVFAFIVPLWLLSAKGYNIFATTASTGYITITVKGSGMNYDVNASAPLAPQTTFDAKVPYSVVEAAQPYILVDPVPELTETLAPYLGIPQIDYTARVYGHMASGYEAHKTPGAAYEKLKEFGVVPAYGTPEYNYTHIDVLIFGKPARAEATYYLNITTTGTTSTVVMLLKLTKDDLAKGYYYTFTDLLVPSMAADYYDIVLFNGTAVDCANRGHIQIVPSAVFHSEKLGSTAMNIYDLALNDIYAEIMALPNDTVDIYGYGWAVGSPITVVVDNVPKMTIETSQIAADGSWAAQYTVPAYKVGTTITMKLEQGGYIVGCYIRVLEIKRNALVVKASTAPAIYDDGTVKLPVVVTATYYDVPIACGDAHVTLTILGENVPSQLAGQTIELTSADCKMPGVWYKELDLGEVKAPMTLVIVAKVEYSIRGTKLTQFAVTTATVDPQIKAYAYEAATAASEAYNKVEELAGTVKNIASDVSSIKATLADIKGSVQQILTQLGKLDEIQASITSAKDEIKETVADAVAMVSSKLDKLTESVNKVANLVNALPSMVSEEVKKALANVPTKDDVKTMLSEVASSITEELGGKIDKLASKVDSMKSDIESMMASYYEKISSTISDLESTLKNELEAVKASVSKLSSSIDEVKSAVSDVAAKVDSLSKTVNDAKNEIMTKLDNVSSKLDKLSSDISGVKSSMSDVSSKVEGLGSKIDSLSTNTMIFGAATLVVSIIVLALLILVAVKSGLLASH
jgi:fused signal recognition particle receptor